MAINDSPQLVGSDVNKIMSNVFFWFQLFISSHVYKNLNSLSNFLWNLLFISILLVFLNFMDDDDGDEIFFLLFIRSENFFIFYLRLFARWSLKWNWRCV